MKRILKLSTVVLLGVFIFFTNKNDCFAQKKLPSIDLPLLDGNVLENKSLENKVVVVNLWGTWCKPCIAEIPELNELEKEFTTNKEVVFLALAKDTPEKLKNFLSRKEFRFIQLDISNAKHFDTALLKMYPKTLIYNTEGKLLKKYVGQLDNENLNQLRRLIQNQTTQDRK